VEEKETCAIPPSMPGDVSETVISLRPRRSPFRGGGGVEENLPPSHPTSTYNGQREAM